MPADDENAVLDLTLRQFLTAATREIVKGSQNWPDFERRLDLFYVVAFRDPKLSKVTGKPHRVLVRLKVTARSLLFDDAAAQGGEGKEPAAR